MKSGSSFGSRGRSIALAFICAILTFFPTILEAQESLCRYETTAVGRYYRVMSVTPATDSLPADTVEISQHIQEREAILRGAIEKSMNPEHEVYVNPDFVVRIDCPSGWTSLALDSILVSPDSTVMVMAVDSVDGVPTDTVWSGRSYWRGELLFDTLTSNQVQLTALAFRNDSLVACEGNCPAEGEEPLNLDFQSIRRLIGTIAAARGADPGATYIYVEAI